MKNKDKKRAYTSNKGPDYFSWLVFILFYSILVYFVIKIYFSKQLAVSFLFLTPLLITFFLFYLFLPIRLINFLISRLCVGLFLRNVKKNEPSETVVILGKDEYRNFRFWISPNYDVDLIFLVKYLKEKGKKFSLYKNTDLESLDKIMSDNTIKEVYLFGHGSRHGFSLSSTETLYYCRYDNKEYFKDFVHQLHCNPYKGKSLVEYVVPKSNQKECILEEGYINSLGIINLFLDKIFYLKKYNKFQKEFLSLYYVFLSFLPTIISMIFWIFIFTNYILK